MKRRTKPVYDGFDPYSGTSIVIDPSTGSFSTSGNNSPTSTTGDIDGPGKGWLSSLWNKLTGGGTTRQQDELNESSEAYANRRFQAEQAQLDYDRQVEFYEQYQSIGAQMRQYRENGLNPMLMAGGVQPSASTPSTSVPSGSMPSGASAHATSPMSGPLGINIPAFLSQLLNFKKLQSEINLNESMSAKNLSEAAYTDKKTSWVDTLSSIDVAQVQQDITESEARVNNLLASTAKTYSDIDVNNKTIEIGNARISLMGSQETLNVTQAILNRLNAHQLSLLMPYVQARAEAEISLTNAKTSEAQASAERQLHEASFTLLQHMKELKLIDGGYYDSLIESAEWSAASSKRKYKWAPINDICTNFSKVAIGVGSVIGSIKGTSSMPFTSVSGSSAAESLAEVPDIFL